MLKVEVLAEDADNDQEYFSDYKPDGDSSSDEDGRTGSDEWVGVLGMGEGEGLGLGRVGREDVCVGCWI